MLIDLSHQQKKCNFSLRLYNLHEWEVCVHPINPSCTSLWKLSESEHQFKCPIILNRLKVYKYYSNWHYATSCQCVMHQTGESRMYFRGKTVVRFQDEDWRGWSKYPMLQIDKIYTLGITLPTTFYGGLLCSSLLTLRPVDDTFE